MAGTGLTPTGWDGLSAEEIKTQLDDIYKAIFSDSVGSEPDGSIPVESLMGQEIRGLQLSLAKIWDLLQIISAMFDPDSATDTALESLSALTGTLRLPARPTTVIITATGDTGTVIDTGKIVTIPIVGTSFTLDTSSTLVAATAWAATTVYTLYAIRTANGKIYVVTFAGTSGAIAPSHTSGTATDGSVTWAYVGDGVAYADIPATATKDGPYAAVAFSITQIVTPGNSGWKSVNNVLDANVGALKEDDINLRIRREYELTGSSSSTLNALRAQILRVGLNTVNPVTLCVVYENFTEVTDADGIPPKSFEALVLGGTNQDIFDTILKHKPLGIRAHGNTTGTSIDSAGNTFVVKFSRPVELLIYVEIDVLKVADEFPINGVDLIKAAILERMSELPWRLPGRDVFTTAISSPVNKVSGVLDVLQTRIGLMVAPTGTGTITVTSRQIAKFDSARILVTTFNGTP